MVRVRRFVDPARRPPRIFAGRADGVCRTAPARVETRKCQGGPGPPRGPTGAPRNSRPQNAVMSFATGWRTERPP